MVTKKIAIVEDDHAILSMYVLKLKNAGFEVKSAINGEEGLKLAKEFLPDLILLDIKMPQMTGDELLEKMRQSDWGSNIRVIILTNISKDEAPPRLRFLGVDRYIVKAHYTPSQVLDTVKEVLAKTL